MHGKVLGREGQELPRLDVALFARRAGGGSHQGRTRNGEFTLDRLEPGPYTLHLSLGLEAGHSSVSVVALAIANAVLGMALGLAASAFARTEFQAVQFMPALVLPQILLCGLIVPRDQMAGWMEALSRVVPLTYAYDALDRLASEQPVGGRFWVDVLVVTGVTLLALALGAATLRRRTA